MKNAITLLILLVCISLTSCGQASLKYDFAEIESQSEVDALLIKMMQENENAKIDTVYRFNEITVKGMHYAGVPIKSALITDNYTLLTTDTLNFSGKKLLEAIEGNNGLTKRSYSYNDDIEFQWITETEDIEYKLKLVNGKHLASLGDKDYAEVTIKYKPVYDIPLANIHREIKTFENQPVYEYQISSAHIEYDIFINEIPYLYDSSALNYFITSERTSIKVIIKPRTNQNGQPSTGFNENASFSIDIINKDTDKVIKTESRADFKGSNPIEIKFDFNSELPYYPKAWTEGDNLRNDKNLKEKIIALYDKLGKAVLSKDEQTLNDMLYQCNFEMQQLNYDTNFQTSRNEWEWYLEMHDYSYKYSVAKDFEIDFSADGKLIYVKPKDKMDLFTFTGKRYSETPIYYLYQPKGSNELKIIR